MPQFGGKNAKKKSSSSTTKRHFTVVIGSKEHGLYVSSSPSSAARKAVSKLCATDKKRKVDFSIREITQGSKKKTYGPYLGYIEKLDKPIELKGRVIKYKPVAKLSGKTGAKKGGMKGTDPGKLTNNQNTNNTNKQTWINELDSDIYSDLEKRYMKEYDTSRAFDRIANRELYKTTRSDPEYKEINSNRANELDRLVHEKTRFRIKKNKVPNNSEPQPPKPV
jgi:hypothetical protein